MTDLALAFDTADIRADLLLADGALATDGGLRSAILISLFTDARAADDDVLPEAGSDRRGWWGDALATIEGDRIGSKLWLLRRAKKTAATLADAQSWAMQALQWLVDDGLVAALQVSASVIEPDGLGLTITIRREGSDTPARFDFIWKDI